MIEMDLCSARSKVISTEPVPPLFSAIEPQPNMAKTLNPHVQGVLERLQWTFPATSMPVFQHSTPGRKLSSVAMGPPLPTRVEDPLSPEGADSAMSEPLATSSQVSQCMATPKDIPTTVPISHSPHPPPVVKTPTATSIPSTP